MNFKIEKMQQNILFFIVMIFFVGCKEEVIPVKYEGSYLPMIKIDQLSPENRAMTMFEDNEDPAIMYNQEDRFFRVNELVQVIQTSEDSVQISFYNPVELKDVKIYAKMYSDYQERFVMFHFDKLPAFHRSYHKIPLATGTYDYMLESGGTVNIEKMEKIPMGFFEFSYESTDPLVKKLKKIQSSRLVKFSDQYHKNKPDKYLPMNPVLAKEAIAFIINFSYALSHPLYKENFLNYDVYKKEIYEISGTPFVGAIDWHGNLADENGVYDYFTKEQIATIFNQYLDNRLLYMAMVCCGSAWGGGPLASQWESDYVTGHWKGGVSVWSHEYSHHTGFSHTSNLCNSGEGGGQQGLMNDFYSYLYYINDLPFLDADILKTYTKAEYLNGDYKNQKPIPVISEKNPFLIKYNGEGSWDN